MKYFVSSDIHGFFTYWQEALVAAKFDINNPEHKIVLCGDIFDRGKEAKLIIQYILAHKDKIILIRGNHEDLMQDMIIRNYPTSSDIHNGTYDTIIDLGYNELISMKEVANKSRINVVLDLCENFYETKKYIFCHSWIPTTLDFQYDEYWRLASYFDFYRARWMNPVLMYEMGLFDKEKTIVSGHYHVSFFHERFDLDKEKAKTNYLPFISPKLISLDAATVISHKVNCLVLEDEELNK